MRLHYSLVKGAKIKQTTDKVLHPRQDEPISFWDTSTNPATLATTLNEVGRVFSECLSS